MKIINSTNEVYEFSNKEVENILIWAFGYADIARQGFLPIDLEKNVENSNLYKKLKQCLRDEVEVIQRTRRYY